MVSLRPLWTNRSSSACSSLQDRGAGEMYCSTCRRQGKFWWRARDSSRLGWLTDGASPGSTTTAITEHARQPGQDILPHIVHGVGIMMVLIFRGAPNFIGRITPILLDNLSIDRY